MGTVLDGVIYGLTSGTTVFNGIPKSFTIPGILKIADIPFITIVAVVLYLVFHIFMNMKIRTFTVRRMNLQHVPVMLMSMLVMWWLVLLVRLQQKILSLCVVRLKALT